MGTWGAALRDGMWQYPLQSSQKRREDPHRNDTQGTSQVGNSTFHNMQTLNLALISAVDALNIPRWRFESRDNDVSQCLLIIAQSTTL